MAARMLGIGTSGAHHDNWERRAHEANRKSVRVVDRSRVVASLILKLDNRLRNS